MNDYSEPATSVATGARERRVPFVAALMSAMLPGFGQLYNGQVNRAIWFFLIFCLVALPLTALIALVLPPKLMVLMLSVITLITLGVWLYGIYDAWRNARRLQSYVAKPWQTTSGYALVFLLCGLIVLPLLVRYIRDNHVQAFRTPSGSMMPSVQPGDFIFVNKSYNCPTCRESVKRGDVAVFVYPNNRNNYYIKRIIGLPGDVVSAESGIVKINGEGLREPVASNSAKAESTEGRSWMVQGDVQEFSVTVEPGHVFVLGDNRSASNDSRKFGQVPLSDVVGSARQIWMSIGEEGVRWDRFGSSVVPQTVPKL